MVGPPKNQFSRPGIDLGGMEREWKHVTAIMVQPGDTVANVGLVAKVQVKSSVLLTNMYSVEYAFQQRAELYAFVKKDTSG